MTETEIIEKIDKIERDLCSALDKDVYIPVRDELNNTTIMHSLGRRKEDFKIMIHNELGQLKQEIKNEL
jgi:hypothetical protein